MNNQEYRAHLATSVRDCIVVTGTAATIVALFHMSRSWHALWALALIPLFSGFKNVTATKTAPAAQEPDAK